MDSVHAALVTELVRLLCVELDLHYNDRELANQSDDEIRTMQEAAALLFIAGHEPPEIYGHILKRIAQGERSEVAGAAGPTAADNLAHEESGIARESDAGCKREH